MQRDDPGDISIDERLDELALLLAAGFLRLKRRTGCLPSDAPPSPDSAASESAESSKISTELSCHLSESSAPCALR